MHCGLWIKEVWKVHGFGKPRQILLNCRLVIAAGVDPDHDQFIGLQGIADFFKLHRLIHAGNADMKHTH